MLEGRIANESSARAKRALERGEISTKPRDPFLLRDVAMTLPGLRPQARRSAFVADGRATLADAVSN